MGTDAAGRAQDRDHATAVNDAADRMEHAQCKRTRCRRHNGTRQGAHERRQALRGGDRLKAQDLPGAPASSEPLHLISVDRQPVDGKQVAEHEGPMDCGCLVPLHGENDRLKISHLCSVPTSPTPSQPVKTTVQRY